MMVRKQKKKNKHLHLRERKIWQLGPVAAITEASPIVDNNEPTNSDGDIECLQFTSYQISKYFRQEKECYKLGSVAK